MSFQEITIVGNVGKVQQLRQTAMGTPVLNFSVAVNRQYGDEDQTTWFDVATWNGTAETMSQHLQPSQLVLVKGSVSAQIWFDEERKPRTNLKVSANSVRFLGKRPTENTVEEEEIPF